MNSEQKQSEPHNPVAVATVIQVQAPSSAKPGDKAWISETGELEGWVGGGCVQPAIIKFSDQVWQSGQPCLLRVAPDGQWDAIAGMAEFASSCLGRGSVLLFIEPLNTKPTLCVMGESLVARRVADQAVNLNLNVVMQAPGIDNDSVSNQVTITNAYEQVKADYIVIATQGKGDKQALMSALASDCQTIRMVVSSKKLAALKSLLSSDGVEQANLDRITGPAGLRIGAKLPEEIALSVLAEIIQLRRSVGASMSDDSTELVTKPASQSSCQASTISENKKSSGCCND